MDSLLTGFGFSWLFDDFRKHDHAPVNIIPPSLSGLVYPGESIVIDPGEWCNSSGGTVEYSVVVDGVEIATSSPFSVDLPDAGTPYSVSIRVSNAFGFSDWYVITGTVWSPSDVLSLQARFIGDQMVYSSLAPNVPAAPDASVIQWASVINAHTAAQPGSVTVRPTYRAAVVNGTSASQWDGGDRLEGSNSLRNLFRNVDYAYMMVVSQHTSPTDSVGVLSAAFSRGDGLGLRMGVGKNATNQFNAAVGRLDGVNSTSLIGPSADNGWHQFTVRNEGLDGTGALRMDGAHVAVAGFTPNKIADTISGSVYFGRGASTTVLSSGWTGYISDVYAFTGTSRMSRVTERLLERFLQLRIGVTNATPFPDLPPTPGSRPEFPEIFMALSSDTGITQSEGYVTVWEDSSRGITLFPLSTGKPVVSGGLVLFDGVTSRMKGNKGGLILKRAQDLPDGAFTSPGVGITCTGLTRDLDGNWWIGNDGRIEEGDPSPYIPTIVKVSSDGSTLLQEIPILPLVPDATTMQGVTFDTLRKSLWFVDYTGGKVYEMTTEGVLLRSVSVGIQPNGLTYDQARDCFIVMLTSGVVKRYSCVDLSLVETLPTLTAVGPDHLFLQDDGILLATSGGNIANGSLYTLQLLPGGGASGTWVFQGTPQGSDAIEGGYNTPFEFVLTNDAYFHNGLPKKNRMLFYPPIKERTPQQPEESILDIVVGFRVETVLGATVQAICTVGGSVGGDGPGWGMYMVNGNTQTLRVYCNTSLSGTTERVFYDIFVDNMRLLNTIRFRVDLNTKTGKVWQNGLIMQNNLNFAACGASLSASDVRIGAAASGNFLHGSYGEVWVSYGNTEDEMRSVEGYVINKLGIVP